MSIVRTAISFCSLGLLLALAASAQAAGMVVYQEEVELSEGGTTQRPVLLTETHQVRFQPPARWHMELTSTNQTVMFYEPGLEAGIMMRLWTEGATNQENGSSTGWRKRVEDRLEQGEVIAEFKVYSANAEGIGIDLEQSLTPVTRAAYRIALIPFEGGLVEFELRTSAEWAAKYQRVFRHLVGSFLAERRDSEPAEGADNARPASPGFAPDGGLG
jgi:hypothetical protein